MLLQQDLLSGSQFVCDFKHPYQETTLNYDSLLAKQVCRKLNQERPGGLLVAVPGNMPGECLVLCLKVKISVPQAEKYAYNCGDEIELIGMH